MDNRTILRNHNPENFSLAGPQTELDLSCDHLCVLMITFSCSKPTRCRHLSLNLWPSCQGVLGLEGYHDPLARTLRRKHCLLPWGGLGSYLCHKRWKPRQFIIGELKTNAFLMCICRGQWFLVFFVCLFVWLIDWFFSSAFLLNKVRICIQ